MKIEVLNLNKQEFNFTTNLATVTMRIIISWLITKVSQKNSVRLLKSYIAGIYLPIVNSRNSRTRCEVRSKLTIKTHQKDAADVFLVSLFLALNIFNALL